MSYSRTDVMHIQGSIPQAISTLAATAGALRWNLVNSSADSMAWEVAHGIIDWRISVCAIFMGGPAMVTVQFTSQSPEIGAASHVDEAAAELQMPAQHALPVLSHYGDSFAQTPPLIATPRAVSWPWLTTPVPQVSPTYEPPAWTAFTPPPFEPWQGFQQVVSGGGEEVQEEGGIPGPGPGGPGPGGPSPEPPWTPDNPRPEPQPDPTPPRNPLQGLSPANNAAGARMAWNERHQQLVNYIGMVKARIPQLGPIGKVQEEAKLANLQAELTKMEG